jgi:hypothetical protein
VTLAAVVDDVTGVCVAVIGAIHPVTPQLSPITASLAVMLSSHSDAETTPPPLTPAPSSSTCKNPAPGTPIISAPSAPLSSTFNDGTPGAGSSALPQLDDVEAIPDMGTDADTSAPPQLDDDVEAYTEAIPGASTDIGISTPLAVSVSVYIDDDADAVMA